jgi:glycerol-3-phosphate dehydrogenase (NAD(P)+)
MDKILIIGAGSWGQGLYCVFSKQLSVDLWMRNTNKIEDIRNNIEEFVKKPINFVHDIKNLEQYSLIIIATPMNALRDMILMLLKTVNSRLDLLPDIFVTCKGLESSTGKLAYEIIEEIAPNLSRYGILVGPSFASELIKGLPTLIALSSFDHEFTIKWINQLKISNFRIYGHSDVIGACAASALKNVIAIAVGISYGLSLGQNTAAALITRGLYEMKKFIIAVGGTESSVYGLTGMGDLILTCHEQSRNYNVGLKLAQGMSIEHITNILGHVAEGVSTAKEVFIKANSLAIDMPISRIIYQIIYENLNIQEAIHKLLDRPSKMES